MAAKKNLILSQLPAPTSRPTRHTRIAAAIAGVSMLGVMTAFAISPDSLPPAPVLETISFPLPTLATSAVMLNEARFLREDQVRRNDTIASLLNRLGVADETALNFIRNDPAAAAISRQLRPGKQVSAFTDAGGSLLRLNFPLNSDQDKLLVVEKRQSGLTAFEETAPLERHVMLRSGTITSSLFGATDAAGIPDSVATQLAEIFGGEIDFHRDLRKGDRFAIRYETLNAGGKFVRSGRILAAEIVNGGKTLRALYHANADGSGGYYDADGRSLRKAFLRSPLEFSRVTSGFTASRLHPVLKEWRAHKGVDYGAPTGTRVRSTGDGVIEFAGRQGGYGNLIVVRHPGGYTTAYGHLNAFAPGIQRGARIQQGDAIGFVGKTGLASGPHLHYEFRVNDVQVNPLAIALPETPPLNSQALTTFKPMAREALAHFELAYSATSGVIE